MVRTGRHGVVRPEPTAGQVRVRNRAAALNFFDILQIQGKYQVKPPFPFTPGAEIAGEIGAVGESVTVWRVGDRVLGFPGGAGFSEQTVNSGARVPRYPPIWLRDAAGTALLNSPGFVRSPWDQRVSLSIACCWREI